MFKMLPPPERNRTRWDAAAGKEETRRSGRGDTYLIQSQEEELALYR
jgi:hypothetical protein